MFQWIDGATPPCAPPSPSVRTSSRHAVIGVLSGEVKFAGSPPINAESLSAEGLRLRTGIQKSITAIPGLFSHHLASLIQFFYTYFYHCAPHYFNLFIQILKLPLFAFDIFVFFFCFGFLTIT